MSICMLCFRWPREDDPLRVEEIPGHGPVAIAACRTCRADPDPVYPPGKRVPQVASGDGGQRDIIICGTCRRACRPGERIQTPLRLRADELLPEFPAAQVCAHQVCPECDALLAPRVLTRHQAEGLLPPHLTELPDEWRLCPLKKHQKRAC